MSDKAEATVTETSYEEDADSTTESVTSDAVIEEEVAAPAEETPDNEPESEPEAEAEGEETEAEGDEPDAEEDDAKPAKRNKPGKAQRMIRRQQSEIDELKGMVKALVEQGQGGQPKPGTGQPSDTPAPKQEDFQDYSDYIEARSAWAAEKALADRLAKVDQDATARERQSAQQAALDRHMDRVEAAREALPDFDEVAFSDDAPVSEHMLSAILDSKQGPKIQYYLGSHPEEAERIVRLSPVSQIREMGMIEAKVSAPSTRKTTKAPKPVRPVGGSGSGVIDTKDPEKMSMSQYEAYRKKSGKK